MKVLSVPRVGDGWLFLQRLLKLPDIKVANNKLLIDVSVSMPAAIALDIILPHMSKSIFTEKLAANFGLAAFPLLN
ncbi:hypothetical protein ABCV29_006872 [Pseudomonas aeruginosa]